MMKPEPRLFCLNGRRCCGPKKRSKGSQNSCPGSCPPPPWPPPWPPGPCCPPCPPPGPPGAPGPPKGPPGPPNPCGCSFEVEVVEMLTTDGLRCSASSAKSGREPLP